MEKNFRHWKRRVFCVGHCIKGVLIAGKVSSLRSCNVIKRLRNCVRFLMKQFAFSCAAVFLGVSDLQVNLEEPFSFFPLKCHKNHNFLYASLKNPLDLRFFFANISDDCRNLEALLLASKNSVSKAKIIWSFNIFNDCLSKSFHLAFAWIQKIEKLILVVS